MSIGEVGFAAVAASTFYLRPTPAIATTGTTGEPGVSDEDGTGDGVVVELSPTARLRARIEGNGKAADSPAHHARELLGTSGPSHLRFGAIVSHLARGGDDAALFPEAETPEPTEGGTSEGGATTPPDDGGETTDGTAMGT